MQLRAAPPRPVDPYPADWHRVSDFEYLSPLSLIRPVANLIDRLGEDGDYVLQHDFDCAVRVDGRRHVMTAPRGLVTDLTSVPPGLRGLVGRVGPWLEAAIIHDYLYVAWSFLPGRAPQERDRLFADEVMRLAMEAARVRARRRWAIYLGLRALGARAYARADPDRAFADLGDHALQTPLVVPDR